MKLSSEIKYFDNVASLIKEVKPFSYDIPEDYTWEDLWKYKCYKLRTKRLKKKFRKNPRKYIGPKVNTFLGIRRIGGVAAEFILDVTDREGFARKIFPQSERL